MSWGGQGQRERERERENTSGGGAEREGERMREHQWGRGRERGRERIPSRLRTVSTEPDMGLKLTDREIRASAKIKSWMLN